MTSRTKRIAVVASGWHFPLSFYRDIAQQELPKGWEMELYCVSHRHPKYAKEEKKGRKFTGDRAELDKRLYDKVATSTEIKRLGWKYKEYPNTIGDWGNTNQWLAEHDYSKYELFLFTHDDNLILNHTWFKDVIKDESFADWDILSNSLGMPQGSLRGSCEFFKPSLLKKMGGKFDLSETTLTRIGQNTATESVEELYDWNTTVYPLTKFIEENDIKVGYLSPSYRVSAYCIEGERGYIGNTHGINTAIENEGLAIISQMGSL
jgi:hypothetical protein